MSRVLRAATSRLSFGIQRRHFCAAVVPETHLCLFYKYVDNILDKRGPHRAGHIAHAQSFQDKGLLLGGAFADRNVDGALVVFKTEDESLVKQFAENDPYVLNGLVTEWEIRPWTVVVDNTSAQE